MKSRVFCAIAIILLVTILASCFSVVYAYESPVPYTVDSDVSHIKSKLDSLYTSLQSGYKTPGSMLSDMVSYLSTIKTSTSSITTSASNISTKIGTIESYVMSMKTDVANVVKAFDKFSYNSNSPGYFLYQIYNNTSNMYSRLGDVNSNMKTVASNISDLYSILNTNAFANFPTTLTSIQSYMRNLDSVFYSGSNYSYYNTLGTKRSGNFVNAFSGFMETVSNVLTNPTSPFTGLEDVINKLSNISTNTGTMVSSLKYLYEDNRTIISYLSKLYHPEYDGLHEASKPIVEDITNSIFGSGSSLKPGASVSGTVGAVGDTIDIFGDASAAGGFGDALSGALSGENGLSWFTEDTRSSLDSVPATYDLDPSQEIVTNYYDDYRDEVLSFFAALGGGSNDSAGS